MRHPTWEGLKGNLAAYTGAVVLAGAAALAASLSLADWPSVRVVVALCAAGTVANALMVPMPGGGYQTLGPAVAVPAIALFGAPVAALAMAVGALVGNAVVRRRPLRVASFNAGQRALATLAAGVLAHLLDAGPASWARPLFAGRVDTAFALDMLAAASAFVLVTAVLVNWRVSMDRRVAFMEVMGTNLAPDAINTLSLSLVGVVVALVLTGNLPPGALLVAIPALLVSTVLMVYAQHRRAAAELETLQAVAAELGRGLGTEEIARSVAAAASRHISADILGVWLRPPGEPAPQPVYFRGPGGMEVARQLGPDGFSVHALRTGRPVRIADFDRDPRGNPRAQVLFGHDAVRSALVAPVTAGGEALGVIALAAGTRAFFGARHERLLGALADQAAVVVWGLHAQDRAQRQSSRLAAMQHPGLLAGVALDPAEACRHLVVRAAAMLGAPYAFLALLDPRSMELHGEAAHGMDGDALRRLRAVLDGEPTALHEAVRAVRGRRPVVCEDTQASPCPLFQSHPGARWALTVPLIRQGQAVGALTVARGEPHQVTEAEIAALEAIAAQGAAAIESARRHAATEARLRTVEAMLGFFRRLGALTEPHEVFGLIAENAGDVLGAGRCLLVVWGHSRSDPDTFAAGVSEEFARAAGQHIRTAIGRIAAAPARPVVLDFEDDPRMVALRDAAEREGVRSGAVFPMRVQNEYVGAMLLLDPQERDAATDWALAEAFVEQATIAARNTTLLAQSERRSDQMALLNRIVGAVSASLDLNEVFRTAASELAAALDIPRIGIYRVEGPLLRLVAHIGSPGAPVESSAAAGVKGRVARTGRPEFLASVREDPEYVSADSDITSLAVVPIAQDGAVTGVVAAGGLPAHPITPQAFEFLIAFARQLGIAAQNAALYEEQRRSHEEMQVLYETAKAVSGTLDLRTMLDSLVSVTCRAFGYENSAVVIADPETGDLIVEAAYGHQPSVVGTRLPAGTGIVGWVTRTGTPLMVDDVLKDPRYHRADERTRSELAVPLIAEGKVIGALNMESARLAAFGPRDLRLLTTLASYAVVAIQNARLYEHARRLAITDGLTELYNHRYLHETLERILERARRDGRPVGLIMLEIDQFKRYNDSYGHKSGDEALRTVAGILRRGSRPSDIVARYGGDEFMVVLPGATRAAAHETAERLRRAVEAYPLVLTGEVITTVTLSVGVAVFPQDASTVDLLIDAVDRAQYIAKRSGGNRVHVAHTS